MWINSLEYDEITETNMSDIIINENEFYSRISEVLKSARNKIVQAVNTTMVETYFEIGRLIVEEEQSGKERAEFNFKFPKHCLGNLKYHP